MEITLYYKYLCGIITRAMNEQNMNKWQLSRLTLIPHTTLHRYLSDPEAKLMRIGDLIKICRALHIDFIDSLVEARDSMLKDMAGK